MSFTLASISVVGVAPFVKLSAPLGQSQVTDNLTAFASPVFHYSCVSAFS